MEIRSRHRCHDGEWLLCSAPSQACGGEMRFSVYLPPRALQGHKTPAVYYLAGLTCNEEHLPTKGGAHAAAARLGLALVACDTSPRHTRYPGDDAAWDFGVGAGFYLDATVQPWSATYRMETHVVHELPALVQANFAIDDARRGIMGHSMGGHGALTLALRHASRYDSVSAFAPIVAPCMVPWGRKAFAGYLGGELGVDTASPPGTPGTPDSLPASAIPAHWLAHDACNLVTKTQRSDTILIDQGLDDRFLQRELQPERFESACAGAGQALILRRHAGYDHSYYFISTFMESHLEHHAALLR